MFKILIWWTIIFFKQFYYLRWKKIDQRKIKQLKWKGEEGNTKHIYT